MADNFSGLGPPQINLAILQVWIHDRQFPDHTDYWEGNWLKVTALCGAKGADVWVSGAIIHLSEIEQWRIALVELNSTLAGQAKRSCLEPNLAVDMTVNKTGPVTGEIRITPDQMTQHHLFRFELDQTYLRPLIAQCRAVLDQYPIRGRAEG